MDKQVKFFSNGTTVAVREFNPKQVSDHLEPRIYILGFSEMSGFYLTMDKAKFDTPTAVYGSAKRRSEKIIKTHLSRNKSTGVLLTGDKGSGKTMLSTLACNAAIENGLPVILIQERFEGTNFHQFIRSLGECVVVIDEFGKIFLDREGEQDDLLTLMDGTGQSKILFILTENDERMVSEYIIGRTGRVHYHFKYAKLEVSVIDEYCNDHQVPEAIPHIMNVYDRALEFSFDNLSSIVEEIKRYPDEDPADLISDLNIEMLRYRGGGSKLIPLKLVKGGREYEIVNKSRLHDNPLEGGYEFCVEYKEDGVEKSAYFDMSDFVDRDKDHIVFTNYGVTVKMQVVESPSYVNLLV